MAKSRAMEIIEQHLEKLVLGVCLLFLLGTISYWGLASRRRVELHDIAGNIKTSPPAEVDQQLHDLARSVMTEVEAKKPHVPPSADYLEQFRLLTAGKGQGKPPAMGAFGIPAQAIGTTEGPELEKIDLKELLDVMPAPSKPLVKAVRVLPNNWMTGNSTDEMVAHVLSIYSWQQLSDAWKDKLRNSGVPSNPTAIALVAQVQEELPDGNWSPTKDVTSVFEPAKDTQGTPILLPQVPTYDGTNAGYLAHLRWAMSEATWQNYILEPNYWQVWWPGHGWTDWRVNLPDNEITRQAAAAPPGGTVGGAGPGAPLQPISAIPKPAFPTGPSRGGYRPFDEESLADEHRGAPGGPGAGPASATPTPRAEQIPAPQLPTVPDIREQMQDGRVLVWFHDNSLQPLKVYRYRLAVKFLNPLLGFDNAVKEASFAADPAVTTPFSEWSDPVEVPQPTEFFLVGATESEGKVTGRVTVFTRSTGQQVKDRFTVVPGQSIGRVKEILLTNPADGSVGRVPVDFTTGDIAVEIRLSSSIMGGRSVAEMFYLDEKGRLLTKVDINSVTRNDREYQRYKELEAQEKVTRLAAEAAKAAIPPAPGP
jgi:hypothetical protein